MFSIVVEGNVSLIFKFDQQTHMCFGNLSSTLVGMGFEIVKKGKL